MSTKYIFDMDLTLYSKEDFIDDTDDEKFYNNIKQKNKLRELLLTNPSKKYLLTNASFEHANKVLEKLNLDNIFEDIISGYNIQVYKPTPYIYHEAQYEFEIDDKDKVYYFEDLKENLKISKELYNWSTVLIDPTHDDSKDEYIDYTFKTIEDAMTYFNLGMTNKL
jgi:FMN phosphatase YigB (HAD superfamily)